MKNGGKKVLRLLFCSVYIQRNYQSIILMVGLFEQ